jgi:hypothetical protein
MAKIVSGNLAALLVCASVFTGCQMCGTECEVTKVCCPEVKTEKVEKTGWDVECEQICIPPVHCPCFGGCERSCGKVIAVKKLKADKIECGERCVIEYKLFDGCPNGAGHNGQSCQAGASYGEEAVPEKAPTEAPAPKPEAPPQSEEPLPPSPEVAGLNF